MATKKDFASWCVDQLERRHPVIMGGKGDYWVDLAGVRRDPPRGKLLFDCSGFITYGVKALNGIDYRDTHNAQALWNKGDPIDKPEPGDLGFYGRDGSNVVHVIVSLAGGYVVSADGATNKRRTVADLDDILKDELCRVRFHASEHFRHDQPFLGWRKNPLIW